MNQVPSLARVSPDNERQLYQRACALTGHRLDTLAARAGFMVPNTMRHTKGWAGLLLEQTLGASSGSKPQQDFPQLGIELKTVPVDEREQPLESTFVCVAPLIGNSGLSWSNSLVRHKLQRVLWIPIVGRRGYLWTERRIGIPRLWSPTVQQERQLQTDWEELMDHIVLGDIAQISAHRGEVLQLRPKAANSRARTAAVDHQGRPISTLPLGFYLRTAFTAQLLA
ncbi:DNA mismatch repair endonuclease MutH [unidentified bacterial endosymbiont]|uniref:DNA mismatch repair endonuclease MutH n=1 Tax=unidentified bacterial endosymbiont TaxID=2355 RepID=UPI00209FBCEF|nr:DNA mismatch repair endonuclease MutH [unidentified bacterial endosymbiont]